MIAKSLGYTIWILTWRLPKDHDLYTNNLRATAKIISNLVKDLEKMHICPGVRPTERCCDVLPHVILKLPGDPLFEDPGLSFPHEEFWTPNNCALSLEVKDLQCGGCSKHSHCAGDHELSKDITIAQVTMNLVKTCWLYLDSLTILLHLWASFGNNRKSSSQEAKLESGITPWLLGIAYLLQPNHHPAMRSWEIATFWYCQDRER